MVSPYTAWPIIVKTYSYILEQFFPEECLHCGQESAWLCSRCVYESITIKAPTCPFCSRLSGRGRTCSLCRVEHPLTGAQSVWHYKGPIVSLIRRFKYDKVHASHSFMSPYLTNQLINLNLRSKNRLMITSVPSTNERLIERGFNQSELLARAVARELDLPYLPLLERQAQAPSQTTLSRKERLARAATQFTLLNQALSLEGKIIVIIDDVITTGATLSYCARELKRGGAKQVWGITVAKD